MQDNKLNTNAWINITHNSNTYDRTLPRINTIRLITASCTIIPVIIQSIIKCPLNILADNRNPNPHGHDYSITLIAVPFIARW